ncbi:galactonate dehydratase [Haloarcula pellucida]|uniref:Galactonate dehydratase n=1 Tax=Haloarcula pellucida TaxID=1427151 RepID=A0A830GPJ5_9EURY|nr:galactonate dehydratase [Halomicroarcula pellucida]MBX0350207.1 galactonate dehydratase [Halomicroarcula pellucida]GGO00890.1 galactonate dehydratase [Halomicroarcula pellucida]
MQITDYELFAVPPRWLLLKLETDEGLIGWGEPIIQGRLETVRAAVGELIEGYLLGTDPLRTEYHWRKLYQSGYFRGGPVLMSALAGIDQALWDVKGRHYGAPVHELLGGHVRDRLLVHQWIGGAGPEDIAKSAAQDYARGYRAFKLNNPREFRPLETTAAIDRAVERVAALRDTVGDDALVGVDFHGRVSKPMALELLRRLEPYNLMFADQPLTPEHGEAFAALNDRTSVPVSTGERLYSRYDFKPLLVDDAVSVIQPDVTHVGGISEMRKVASMAEAFDVAVVPHCPLGPVAFAASLQVGFASQNVVVQEQDLELHDPESSQRLALLEDPETFQFEDGYVERPTGPGLGIEVDEAYVRQKAQTEVNWYNPVWHHEDGSIAEW